MVSPNSITLSKQEKCGLIGDTCCLLHIMCNHDDRIIFLQLHRQILDPGCRNRIKCRGRFIHQKHFRLYCKRSVQYRVSAAVRRTDRVRFFSGGPLLHPRLQHPAVLSSTISSRVRFDREFRVFSVRMRYYRICS